MHATMIRGNGVYTTTVMHLTLGLLLALAALPGSNPALFDGLWGKPLHQSGPEVVGNHALVFNGVSKVGETGMKHLYTKYNTF